MKGGSQKTASATCAGGINRTTSAAISRNLAARRKLILLEATGQHSREEFSLEKAADYSISCGVLEQVQRVQVRIESTRPAWFASNREAFTRSLARDFPIQDCLAEPSQILTV